MLSRVSCFFDFFDIGEGHRGLLRERAARASAAARGMMHMNDYLALSAIVHDAQPQRVFEIGTYLGVTSNFFLESVSDCRVVSIAFPGRAKVFLSFGSRYNNTDLRKKDVGSLVYSRNRERFFQLYGDSHALDARELTERFGYFDLVLIDGDHSREGVRADTQLAQEIIGEQGIIVWHDANPKERYLPVRKYLEDESPLDAIATEDSYIGGVAYWRRQIGTGGDGADRVGRNGRGLVL